MGYGLRVPGLVISPWREAGLHRPHRAVVRFLREARSRTGSWAATASIPRRRSRPDSRPTVRERRRATPWRAFDFSQEAASPADPGARGRGRRTGAMTRPTETVGDDSAPSVELRAPMRSPRVSCSPARSCSPWRARRRRTTTSTPTSTATDHRRRRCAGMQDARRI